MQTPIDRYVTELARRLTISAANRDAALAETRTTLEARAASLRAEGASDEESQRQATQALGDVRRVAQRLNARHPIVWNAWRWIRGIIVGGVVTWALWLAGTLPAMVYYYSIYPVTTVAAPAPDLHYQVIHALIQAAPPASSGFYAFLVLGWFWLLPMIALYLILPALWGHRTENWWTPGLAFGLGTWLSIPWFAFYLGSADWAVAAEARVVAVALPLALLASAGGWLRRRRRVATSQSILLASE